ncbi:unnamed protein product [Arctia plantaginis]|uniref:Uncharacterized protein n=1 Tax=Arctia plantaginis TaxID=874455 RepID=A0A8S1ATX8_ARCPL|nr:unnamed protein product [Arctia plantaginis]
MIMVILSACIVGVVAAVVFYLRQIYSIFSKYGVEKEPSVGNMASEQCLVLEYLVDTKLYKNCPEERFIGHTNTHRENLISSYRSNIFIFCTFELKKQAYTNPKNPLCTRSRGSRLSGFCEIFMYFLIWNLRKFQISIWDFVSNNRKEFFRKMVLDITNPEELKRIFRPDTICFFMDLEYASILIYLSTDYYIISGTNPEGFGAGYELTVNSDVQDRIGNGIRRPDTNNNFKLDSDNLCNVTFETVTFRNSSLDSRMYYVLAYL